LPEFLVPCLLIVLAVLAANALYVTGVLDPNPMNQVSGLTTAVTHGPSPGVDAIDPNSGFTAQALGHRAVLDWANGHVPWWNHYEGVGSPLAGEMNAAALFPPVVFMAASNGHLWFQFLLELVAGLATYFLLRRFTRSQWAATAGGIAFALNGTFAWFSHSPVNPIAFLPVIVLGLEQAREAVLEGRRGGWALLAVGLSLSIYAGFPETCFIDGCLVAVWLLARLVVMPERRSRFLLRSGVGVVVGLLLAAPILVAFVTYLPHAYVGAHNGAYALASFPRAVTPQLFFPYIFGPLFAFNQNDHTGLLARLWAGGYLTTGLFALAVVGLTGRRYRVLRLFLGGWVLLALGKTLGFWLPTHLVNLVPGIKAAAFYVYAAPSWEFAVIVLAALGFDQIVSARTRWPLAVCIGLAALVLVVIVHAALPTARLIEGAPHARLWTDASVLWGLAVVVAIAVIAFALPQRWRPLPLLAVLALDGGALFAVPTLAGVRSASVDTAPVTFLQQHLGLERFYTLGPITPDYGSYFGIRSINVNDTPVPKLWAHYIETKLDRNVNPILFAGWTRLSATGPTAAQELVANLPNYEAVSVKYVLVPHGMTLPITPALPVVFSDQLVDIVRLPATAPYYTASDPRCRVRGSEADRVKVTCPAPATVTRRELYMPGWTATVNGRGVPVHEAMHLVQSVPVPAGRSTVTFAFAPRGTLLAAVVFLAGIGCVVVSVVRGVRQRRRTGPEEPASDDPEESPRRRRDPAPTPASASVGESG
jgi:hypothetical protein